MKTIDLYLAVAEASNRMVDAARASNWDALVSAEEECARRIALLQEHQARAAPLAPGAEQKTRVHILGEILAHDAEIRELTLPWLRQLDDLLAGSANARRAGAAYRSDFG